MAIQWFSYTGSDPADPNHYTPVGGTAPSCTGAKQQLCAIQTETNASSEPVLDLNISLEMNRALQNQTDRPTVKLKSR